MDIVLTTPPTEDDVLSLLPLAKLKQNERITHAYDDDLLTDCIKRAYTALDGRFGWLNRSILTQTYTLYLSNFSRVMELPYGPVQSVTSIKYYDGDEVLQTLAASNYEVQTGEFVCKITKDYEATWPTLDERQRAIEILYVAGFGDPDTMDWPIKTAIQDAMILLASHRYRNPAATYAEPRTIAVNRTVQYGLEQKIGHLRVPPDYS